MARSADLSPYKLASVRERLLACRDRLLAIDPTIVEDAKLYFDSLEGEVEGNVMEILGKWAEMARDARDLAEKAKNDAKVARARGDRFEKAEDTLKTYVGLALEDIGLTSLPLGGLTFYRAGHKQHVVTTGPLDDEYMRQPPKEENIAKVKADLLAGKEVKNASLSNKEPYYAIRG